MTTIILLIVAGIAIWWIKGMRDSFVLKDRLVNILVGEYGLSRSEAISLIDQNQRRIFELNEENTPLNQIASDIYNYRNLY
ncbi:MAG: hypothetical protein JJU46_14655 [Balneolaceae bacterium]|nr:hypothetical protein [Balneolaceae bacterium]MCH8535962.1 hypothetical protein [Flavobacteriaceae bacterium]